MRGSAYFQLLKIAATLLESLFCISYLCSLYNIEKIHGFVLFQVDVPSQCKVVSVSCGSDFTFMLTTTGRLLGFGNNDENQLGIDTPQSLRKRQVKVYLRLNFVRSSRQIPLGFFSVWVCVTGSLLCKGSKRPLQKAVVRGKCGRNVKWIDVTLRRHSYRTTRKNKNPLDFCGGERVTSLLFSL